MTTSPTILLLDDDKDGRELFAEALQDEGFRVLQAGKVAEALRLFEAHAPHVLVVDGLLPDRSGVDFIAEVRRRGSDVPVVFASAFWRDTQAYRQLTNDLGVQCVLRKPVGILDLVGAVRDALAGRSTGGRAGRPNGPSLRS